MSENRIDYKGLLLKLLASLTLCEHMGDVSNDVLYVLKALGMEEAADKEWEMELGDWFGEQGITTLYGSSMKSERCCGGGRGDGEGA